ncbi:pyridoxal phosphate-dependent aminotransferase [Nitratireductor sp. B36]|uniref:aminotransferase class I/II-fold pyridoxal phosphate-dependent enzyme n=1 Tax=Nitratireductor sp. B36 TaxID=2762059 RepID=UPI001E3EF4F6|nr:pyridoxal phosphate-dependent aminotransferase [Nitratireductor sp. B36]MCC5780896.1 pyridoxal phosphate-dependent aminotransferase [Nitratireductor sp. B36]
MRDFALEVHFSRWEFNARHHMTASDMESMTLGELTQMAGPSAREELDRLWLGYTETWGAPDLREAIAATYDGLSARDILCFAGAEEGIYAAMRVMLSPEDHAIVSVPNYQAAETVPLGLCAVTGVPLLENDNWRLDLDAVRAAIRPNTKLISVNLPNNPTGALMPQEDFAALVALCREHDLYLFSDEVYRLLESDDKKRLPQAAEAYEKGVSLNVMSKAYGLPGLRIGWIASRDTALLQKLERYKHYLSICNSAPSERLAVMALSVRDRILTRNRSLIAENLEKMDAFFAEYPDLFDWKRPDGGCVAYPRYNGRDGVEQFCHDLVEQAGVLLLPASVYHSELMESPAGRFRIGFGRKGIDAGLAAMRDFLGRRHNDIKPG